MLLPHWRCVLCLLGWQKEIEPVKDESAQRFKDLQEEYTLYEAARKDPKQASEQVPFLAKESYNTIGCNRFYSVSSSVTQRLSVPYTDVTCPVCDVSEVFQRDPYLLPRNATPIGLILISGSFVLCFVLSSCRQSSRLTLAK